MLEISQLLKKHAINITPVTIVGEETQGHDKELLNLAINKGSRRHTKPREEVVELAAEMVESVYLYSTKYIHMTVTISNQLINS